MNSIEFKQEHRYKLLKMCKLLFPEYIDFKWDIIHCTDDIKYNGILFMYKNDGSNDAFHWFEFCMTHLAKKIYKLDPDSGNYSDYLEDILYKHPINYLYKEFKKLKRLK